MLRSRVGLAGTGRAVEDEIGWFGCHAIALLKICDFAVVGVVESGFVRPTAGPLRRRLPPDRDLRGPAYDPIAKIAGVFCVERERVTAKMRSPRSIAKPDPGLATPVEISKRGDRAPFAIRLSSQPYRIVRHIRVVPVQPRIMRGPRHRAERGSLIRRPQRLGSTEMRASFEQRQYRIIFHFVLRHPFVVERHPCETLDVDHVARLPLPFVAHDREDPPVERQPADEVILGQHGAAKDRIAGQQGCQFARLGHLKRRRVQGMREACDGDRDRRDLSHGQGNSTPGTQIFERAHRSHDRVHDRSSRTGKSSDRGVECRREFGIFAREIVIRLPAQQRPLVGDQHPVHAPPGGLVITICGDHLAEGSRHRVLIVAFNPFIRVVRSGKPFELRDSVQERRTHPLQFGPCRITRIDIAELSIIAHCGCDVVDPHRGVRRLADQFAGRRSGFRRRPTRLTQPFGDRRHTIGLERRIEIGVPEAQCRHRLFETPRLRDTTGDGRQRLALPSPLLQPRAKFIRLHTVSPASAFSQANVFTNRRWSTLVASSSNSFGFASTIASVRARLIATFSRFFE